MDGRRNNILFSIKGIFGEYVFQQYCCPYVKSMSVFIGIAFQKLGKDDDTRNRYFYLQHRDSDTTEKYEYATEKFDGTLLDSIANQWWYVIFACGNSQLFRSKDAGLVSNT
jgi:hypothetical protein